MPDRFPAFVIEDTVTGDAAPFDQHEEITAEKIEKFIEKYFRGRNKIPEQTAVSSSLVDVFRTLTLTGRTGSQSR